MNNLLFTSDDSLLLVLLLCLTAMFAGAINSVAGGGTLLTFPALTKALEKYGDAAEVLANATSTFALMPGSLAGSFAYRRELYECRKLVLRLVAPSIVGGAIGSLLVTRFPPSVFKIAVPWLILLAAVLFMLQGTIKKMVGAGAVHSAPTPRTMAAVILGQFFIAIYGGYFGAGIGILMLSVLPFMGTKDIHQTNAAKTILASLINAVTVLIFVIEGVIIWKFAIVMAAAAIAGGFLGAHYARRLPTQTVRMIVIAIGFSLSAYFFWKVFVREV